MQSISLDAKVYSEDDEELEIGDDEEIVSDTTKKLGLDIDDEE
jgi:DNA-directed RNA polymerase subunit beta